MCCLDTVLFEQATKIASSDGQKSKATKLGADDESNVELDINNERCSASNPMKERTSKLGAEIIFVEHVDYNACLNVCRYY
jgi:hypothetical protein